MAAIVLAVPRKQRKPNALANPSARQMNVSAVFMSGCRITLMNKKRISYGVPFKGSKNAIADWVIDQLPPGKRLVDLFAGGCAITHCA